MCQSFELYLKLLRVFDVNAKYMKALDKWDFFFQFHSVVRCFALRFFFQQNIKPSTKMHLKKIAFKFMWCCCLVLLHPALLISRVCVRRKINKWEKCTYSGMPMPPQWYPFKYQQQQQHRTSIVQIDRNSLVDSPRDGKTFPEQHRNKNSNIIIFDENKCRFSFRLRSVHGIMYMKNIASWRKKTRKLRKIGEKCSIEAIANVSMPPNDPKHTHTNLSSKRLSITLCYNLDESQVHVCVCVWLREREIYRTV